MDSDKNYQEIRVLLTVNITKQTCGQFIFTYSVLTSGGGERTAVRLSTVEAAPVSAVPGGLD